MPLKDVYLVSRQLHLVPTAEIDKLENTLGFKLPIGYREYLSFLGSGQFCHGLHVFTPSEVLDPKNAEFLAESLLPMAPRHYKQRLLLSEHELTQSFIFARSDEGDYFVSCPDREGELYELPRQERKMYRYDDGFLEPATLEFYRAGSFNLPFFEPPGSRQSKIRLRLHKDSNVHDIWDHIAQSAATPLQVAEGRIGQGDRVVAFIPDISGCAWLHGQRLSLFSDSEHAHVLEEIRNRIEHLTVA